MTEILRVILASFVGTLGFALLIQAPKRAWIPASAVGAAAFLLYWMLSNAGVPEAVAIFAGSLVGSLLGMLLARVMRMIGTVFIALSIVAFVPGLGLYRCMRLLGAGETTAGAEAGVAAMISIAMIALGIGVGGYLFRVIFPPQKESERHG